LDCNDRLFKRTPKLISSAIKELFEMKKTVPFKVITKKKLKKGSKKGVQNNV